MYLADVPFCQQHLDLTIALKSVHQLPCIVVGVDQDEGSWYLKDNARPHTANSAHTALRKNYQRFWTSQTTVLVCRHFISLCLES